MFGDLKLELHFVTLKRAELSKIFGSLRLHCYLAFLPSDNGPNELQLDIAAPNRQVLYITILT